MSEEQIALVATNDPEADFTNGDVSEEQSALVAEPNYLQQEMRNVVIDLIREATQHKMIIQETCQEVIYGGKVQEDEQMNFSDSKNHDVNVTQENQGSRTPLHTLSIGKTDPIETIEVVNDSKDEQANEINSEDQQDNSENFRDSTLTDMSDNLTVTSKKLSLDSDTAANWQETVQSNGAIERPVESKLSFNDTSLEQTPSVLVDETETSKESSSNPEMKERGHEILSNQSTAQNLESQEVSKDISFESILSESTPSVLVEDTETSEEPLNNDKEENTLERIVSNDRVEEPVETQKHAEDISQSNPTVEIIDPTQTILPETILSMETVKQPQPIDADEGKPNDDRIRPRSNSQSSSDSSSSASSKKKYSSDGEPETDQSEQDSSRILGADTVGEHKAAQDKSLLIKSSENGEPISGANEDVVDGITASENLAEIVICDEEDQLSLPVASKESDYPLEIERRADEPFETVNLSEATVVEQEIAASVEDASVKEQESPAIRNVQTQSFVPTKPEGRPNQRNPAEQAL